MSPWFPVLGTGYHSGHSGRNFRERLSELINYKYSILTSPTIESSHLSDYSSKKRDGRRVRTPSLLIWLHQNSPTNWIFIQSAIYLFWIRYSQPIDSIREKRSSEIWNLSSLRKSLQDDWGKTTTKPFIQRSGESVRLPGVICELSLLLVLYSASRGFSPGTPVFPSPPKPTFDLIWLW